MSPLAPIRRSLAAAIRAQDVLAGQASRATHEEALAAYRAALRSVVAEALHLLADLPMEVPE